MSTAVVSDKSPSEKSRAARMALRVSPPSVRHTFRVLALAAGGLQTLAARNAINPDGRSYLEISRALLARDWAAAITGHWSPLYPLLLTPFLGMFRPALRHEFLLVHLVNFALFVGCLSAFEFFWGQLLSSTPKPDAALSKRLRWALGYTLWIALFVEILPAVTPDIVLAAEIFLAAGMIIKVCSEKRAGASLYLAFGALLGIAYLTKAVMFPLAFVFLMVLLIAIPAKTKTLIALLVFSAICLPQIILLSRHQGRLTFSESGSLAYAWYTYDLPLFNWQGLPSGSGQPAHPTRALHRHPDVFEFNGPIRASYPPWHDPSYWNEGLAPQFQARRVIQHLMESLWATARALAHPVFWVLGLIVFLACSDARKTGAVLLRHWPLLLVVTAAFAAYAATLVTARYLAVWQVLLFGTILCAVRIKPSRAKFARCIAVLSIVFSILQSTGPLYSNLRHGRADDATPDFTTAEGLMKMGIKPEEKIAVIGFGNDAYFAYLDHLYIVAEIPRGDTCEFWAAPPAVQSDAIARLRAAGVQVIVANGGSQVQSTAEAFKINAADCARPGAGWQTIPGNRNYAYRLE